MTDQSDPMATEIAAIKANYALSDDQQAILDNVERVAREVLHPLQEKMDAEEYWPDDLFPKMGEL
ncbi:MAG: acyl-CoA dehydrogenase family protein, partial [Rhodobacteraceae bacterium]|nr:acyl-CoA dehydrogenase family protein [Paracoccaceae bacterium]